MLKKASPTSLTPTSRQKPSVNASPVVQQESTETIDIQQEINHIEELILDSTHIPFVGKTIVDEDIILQQLDLVRLNLPDAFVRANSILERKEKIIEDAENYARGIIEEAQRRAAQILDQLGIIQQAQREAAQIRAEVQQECEAIQRNTIAEIKYLRAQADQELSQMRQMTITECQDLQEGADQYADGVLTHIEQELAQMLNVVRNGRQQLYQNSPVRNSNSRIKDPPSTRNRMGS
jgi:F0F1-type ATP synthase membrane subunit b/b'